MISIIVPCYNCELKIEKTVSSLLNQKCNVPYEIVLVDDGCKDSTPEILDELAKKNEMIKVIHKENGGLVSAWQEGINSACGDRIAFCDNDDYVDDDLISKIEGVVEEFNPDLICYGYTVEYNTGEAIHVNNTIEPGYYDKKAVGEKIYPMIFKYANLDSSCILRTRWTKVYKKALIQSLMIETPKNLTYGEDQVTNFAVMAQAESIYFMDNFFPYHYVRNDASMLGAYDSKAFDKIDNCFKALYAYAEKLNYQYKDLIDKDYYCATLIYIKKEICRNPAGYKAVKNNISLIRTSQKFRQLMESVDISEFKMSFRVFSWLISNGFILLAYVITKLVSKVAGRNV